MRDMGGSSSVWFRGTESRNCRECMSTGYDENSGISGVKGDKSENNEHVKA